MAASWLVLATLMCLSSRSKLPGFKARMNLGQGLFIIALMIAPVMDWISPNRKPEIAYVVLGLALVICGVADGLDDGQLGWRDGDLLSRDFGLHTEDCNEGSTSPHSKGSGYEHPNLFHDQHLNYNPLHSLLQPLGKAADNSISPTKENFFNRAPRSNCANQAAKNVEGSEKNPMAFIYDAYYLHRDPINFPWILERKRKINAALGTTNGYLTSVLMILAPKLVPVEESETVGIVMSLFLMTGLAMGSLLGWLWNI
ncbi:hypothetical protein RJ640_021263 [Escallonia rubra]|uniref:Uncharacterized protein n=1 Tax=Escallonia rubra TaxID=112253 RepID=A0AA88QR40_9ASTE|nr:hypothetical protein RJ640_021263 [Escallonia rubra]